ncbi:MAG: pantothenate kinase, partial [Bacillota bacterium]|nr:pantothenate kinase [Bacillota bacterium]
MLHIGNIDDIVSTAQSGDLSKIDLLISDITSEEMPTLNPNVTASNFGKISDLATKNDMALGIMNLVFQTIGMLAVFATKAVGSKNVVLTGFLATVPQSEMLFRQLEEMFGITFKTPDHAEFATAIGAALCNYKNYPLTEIK